MAPWAIGAFAASAVAHAAGAYALVRSGAGRAAGRAAGGRLRAAGAALALAALAVLAIAAFRLSGSGPGDVLDQLHAASVLAYQVAFAAAVLLRGRLLPAVTVAGVSTALLLVSLGDGLGAPGLLQRAWVALDQAWLLVVVLLACRQTRVRGRSRAPAGMEGRGGRG